MSSTYRFYLLLGLLALLLFCWVADCAWVDPLRDLIDPKSPREQYARHWRREVGQEDTAYQAWMAENERGLRHCPAILLPHREEAHPIEHPELPPALAYGYRLQLPAGRRMRIECTPEMEGLLFGELYRIGGTAADRYYDRVGFWPEEPPYRLEYVARAAEELVLLIQAPPYEQPPFVLQLQDGPSLAFPVEGTDNGDIQSFWGAARDGGRRRHEGNDIFAPKGRPVLAAADGRISRLGNGGLGGKTVWLRTHDGLHLYYAHLDEQWVERGQLVRQGQALGTVGNTGNARTTPPHLHFGIYIDGHAVDPLAYYRISDEPEPARRVSTELLGRAWTVDDREPYYLRPVADPRAEAAGRLAVGEKIWIVGTTTGMHRARSGQGSTYYFVPSKK